MRVQILLILLLQVAQLESLKEVFAYLGGSVTLPSGGNSSWHLSRIKWSIFSNNTWIATYQNERQNIDRTAKYKGRLSLNILTGDLTIHNLTSDDAMEYTVDLINNEKKSIGSKIKLTVTKPLQKPTIKTLFSVYTEGGCWIGLHCSSADEGIDFSWQVNSTNVTAFNRNNPDGTAGLVSTFLNSKQINVQITCISRRNMENVSSVFTPKCDDGELKLQHLHNCRDRCGLCVVFGTFLGVVVGIVIMYFSRVQIKAAWECLRGILCPSSNSS